MRPRGLEPPRAIRPQGPQPWMRGVDALRSVQIVQIVRGRRRIGRIRRGGRCQSVVTRRGGAPLAGELQLVPVPRRKRHSPEQTAEPSRRGCGPGGRGFESRRSPSGNTCKSGYYGSRLGARKTLTGNKRGTNSPRSRPSRASLVAGRVAKIRQTRIRNLLSLPATRPAPNRSPSSHPRPRTRLERPCSRRWPGNPAQRDASRSRDATAGGHWTSITVDPVTPPTVTLIVATPGATAFNNPSLLTVAT